MSSLKDLIRKNLNPITHEVLRRNRVTETFIKEVIKTSKNEFFIDGRKRKKYCDLPMHRIYKACRKDICFRISEPTIMWAFTWELTPQGHSFWDNIDDQIIQEAENLR